MRSQLAASLCHMDALPYIDSLVKEYLLFRGFTHTLRALARDLSSDRGRGFQADQLCELVFRKLLPQHDASELMEVLDFLNKRIYSRLPGSYESVIRKLEVRRNAVSSILHLWELQDNILTVGRFPFYEPTLSKPFKLESQIW